MKRQVLFTLVLILIVICLSAFIASGATISIPVNQEEEHLTGLDISSMSLVEGSPDDVGLYLLSSGPKTVLYLTQGMIGAKQESCEKTTINQYRIRIEEGAAFCLSSDGKVKEMKVLSLSSDAADIQFEGYGEYIAGEMITPAIAREPTGEVSLPEQNPEPAPLVTIKEEGKEEGLSQLLPTVNLGKEENWLLSRVLIGVDIVIFIIIIVLLIKIRRYV